jgi:hypothetical protein
MIRLIYDSVWTLKKDKISKRERNHEKSSYDDQRY